MVEDFARIDAGTFVMGSPDDDAMREDDEVQREVTLTRGFFVQLTEVTQGQWEAAMGDNPSGEEKCGQCPVESVTWFEAIVFANRASRLEGLPSCYKDPEDEGADYDIDDANGLKEPLWPEGLDCLGLRH